MLTYIKNILPRLQNYSQQLNKTEGFVGKRWLLIDDGTNYHSYLFLRDGRIIMTITHGAEQKTVEGSWELLPTNQLYVKRPEPIVLEHAFLGDGILIFKVSGTSNTPFSLYDPTIIPDGNIEAYLNKFLEVKEAAQNSNLEMNSEGKRIYRNPDSSLFYGELIATDDKATTLIIEDGIEKSRFCTFFYNTDRGLICIKLIREYNTWYPNKGDEVLLGDKSQASDGLYIFYGNNDGVKSIIVENGKVSKVEDESPFNIVEITIFFLALLLIIFIFSR